MKCGNKYIVNVVATGFLTLIILSVFFFWTRKLCQAIFYENMVKGETGRVVISPSGLWDEVDLNNPNISYASSASASIRDNVVFNSFGIMQDDQSLKYGKVGPFFIAHESKVSTPIIILFDKKSGLFIYSEVSNVKRGWSKKAILYAGPKGVSEIADKNLGRFLEQDNNLWSGHVDSFTFFDRLSSSFFKISFSKGTVVKGSQLPKDYCPVQMGRSYGFDKNEDSLGSLVLSPPLRESTDSENDMDVYSKGYSLVLDESGGIRKLDNKTLELSRPIATLPPVPVWRQQIRPKDLFAYIVKPLVINGEYKGTMAGSISRDVMALYVEVFDPNGKVLNSETSSIDPFSKPGGPVLVIAMYLLENLQPALLNMGSYFTASSFEATAGHRALFLLPNSIVAMFARDTSGFVGPFFGAILIISPSIILGALLAWRVNKDASITGFSKRTRRYWLIGTILFGLSAYITYRLTRPGEKLVTCANCGNMRRPDMVKCHRCGGKWDIPQLRPPVWRVVDKICLKT